MKHLMLHCPAFASSPSKLYEFIIYYSARLSDTNVKAKTTTFLDFAIEIVIEYENFLKC